MNQHADIIEAAGVTDDQLADTQRMATETTLLNPSEAYDALLDRFVRECAG